MLKLVCNTENMLSAFSQRKILIYQRGTLEKSFQLYKIFKSFNLEVLGICDEKALNLSRCIFKGIPIIAAKRMQYLLAAQKDIIIQCSDNEAFLHLTNNCSFPEKISSLLGEELIFSFAYKVALNKLETSSKYKRKVLLWEKRKNLIVKYKMKRHSFRCTTVPIVICNPGKTADITLNKTFDSINRESKHKKIDYINLYHRPLCFEKQIYSRHKCIKVITAVRDPISQNLSQVYHGFTGMHIDTDIRVASRINSASDVDLQESINSLKELVSHSDDVQWWFDDHIKNNVYPLNNKKPLINGTLQGFFSEFNKAVLNIYQQPFNKEKGYAIIKTDNIEVFVYQLEKLNNIISELSLWIGVPFNELENGNQASDKWIAESYKQAQKEIEITQEYFDKCFDEAFVKHCYSEYDIEKFKARWRPHIKN